MTKYSRTRKFAKVKRLLNPNDNRMFIKQKNKLAIKRYKKIKAKSKKIKSNCKKIVIR